MSIRSLAKELGISPAQTHNCLKRGMPDNVESAKAWRRAHLSGNRAKIKTTLPELKKDIEQVGERIGIIPRLPSSLDEAERIFRELHVACIIATKRAEQLTGNTEAAIDELGRRWSLLAADLLARKLTVVEKVQALRVQSGELVPYVEVRETFVSFLREVRQLALSMPASLAMRCNPADPDFAQQALQDWLRGYFRLLNSAPDGTGQEGQFDKARAASSKRKGVKPTP